MYGQFGFNDDAVKVFDEIPEREFVDIIHSRLFYEMPVLGSMLAGCRSVFFHPGSVYTHSTLGIFPKSTQSIRFSYLNTIFIRIISVYRNDDPIRASQDYQQG